MFRNFIIGTVALIFLVSGCSKSPNANNQSSSASSAGNYISNVSKIISVEKGTGDQAPNFSWFDENGKQITFSDFAKDNVVLVNFWATWCGPCKEELPDLVALNEEYKGKNIKIVGISLDKDADVLSIVHDFAKQQNLNYPIIIDNGDLESAFGGIRGIPTSFFIDKKGNIVQKMLGAQTKETFRDALIRIAS
jgi:peroxiredoxin